MIGKTVSHYKILEKLGEGGMGVVYKAEDTRLKRTVALKFLPPELTRDKDAKSRFIHEAQAASALQHHNICTIHEIDETPDGRMFISMDCYEGETLEQKIDGDPLALDEAIDIASQVAEGLGKAHEAGMVHRDIKPANIIITSDGVVKIVDFGLAKLTGQTRVTKTGTTVGTVAYMSPEQATGEEIDHRSDIFSLGAVFYEMIAGELPFKGDHEAAVLYGITHNDPVPLTTYRGDVPVGVQDVIDRGLAKRRAERYQNASAMANDLKSLRSGPGAVRLRKNRLRRMTTRAAVLVIIGVLAVGAYLMFGEREVVGARIPIAVADFENHTGESELDGLSGLLITSLEQSRSLSVLTRSSMFDILKQMDKNGVEQISEDLGREICTQGNIRVLVVASIRKFDDLYSVDLKAYEMGRREHLFAAREDGVGQSSIPRIIDRIAKKTRGGLKEKSVDIESVSAPIARVTTANMEAYHLYYRGDYYISQLQFDEAEEVLHQAIELDTTFALAYYRMAYNTWWRNHDPAAAGYIKKAIAMIDRIPRREQYLVRALHAALTEGEEAQMPYLREMQLQYPNDKEMLFEIGDVSFHTGNSDTARVYLERVLEQDPGFVPALHHLTWAYLGSSQIDDACAMAKRWTDVTESADAYLFRARAHRWKGDNEEAIAHYKRAREMPLPDIEAYITREMLTRELIETYLMTGNTSQALAENQAILDGEYDQQQKSRAYWDLAGRMLPYMGRYAEALRLADIGIDTLQAWADTSGILDATMVRARLIYFSRRDEDDMWKAIEPTYDYPAEAKNMGYWNELAVFNILYGDLEDGRRLLEKHRSGYYSRILCRSFEHSAVGDCDAAKAAIDTTSSWGAEILSLTADVYPFLSGNGAFARFWLAMCFSKNGDHQSAIEQLNYVTESRSLGTLDAVIIPKAHYELARSYEALGEVSMAVKHYTTFLDIWKQADENLHDLIDAKERLAALVL